jgi:hypothetical protein
VKLLCKKPGLKDNNFQVLGHRISALGVIAKVGIQSCDIVIIGEVSVVDPHHINADMDSTYPTDAALGIFICSGSDFSP